MDMEKQPKSEPSALLTVDQVGAYLVVSRWTVYQLIWSGQLRSVRIGRMHRIPRHVVDAYVSALLEGEAA